MQIRAILEWDDEAQAYSATCPELNFVSSFGQNREEAIASIAPLLSIGGNLEAIALIAIAHTKIPFTNPKNETSFLGNETSFIEIATSFIKIAIAEIENEARNTENANKIFTYKDSNTENETSFTENQVSSIENAIAISMDAIAFSINEIPFTYFSHSFLKLTEMSWVNFALIPCCFCSFPYLQTGFKPA
jgi:hypothetical protein